MISIARPSRRVRESAIAMRYCGLRILPSLLSLIFTAMVKRVLLMRVTLQFSDPGGCRDPVLPRVCAAPGEPKKAKSHGGQPPIVPEQGLAAEIRLVSLDASENFLYALVFHPARHPPALGGAQELVVVPQSAEHHLWPLVS